ncbi:MAG: DUF2892 domain-containing protein [Terriglobia bacterium]
MKLEKNLGPAARLFYAAVGVGLLVLAGAAVVSGAWRLVLGLVGVLIIVEGTVGF